MKNLIFAIIVGLLSGINISAIAQSNDKDNFTVQVDGLGCPFCAYGLEKKFKELKGIKGVKIEMETGIMVFSYPSEKELSIAAVESQVDKAGYTPVSVSIERADGKIEESTKTETIVGQESEMKESQFFVAGNCGMCKARIDQSAKDIIGVTSASWDKKSKLLSVTFDATQTSKEDIEQTIAKSGHDTKTAKTDVNTYNNLPGCCQYERIK